VRLSGTNFMQISLFQTSSWRIWWINLLVNVQLILQQTECHLGVSGHQFTNFCNCFRISSNWQLTTIWLQSWSSCPSLKLLNYSKTCTSDSFISMNSLHSFNHFPSYSSCFLK
jgi:hypothetical protein